MMNLASNPFNTSSKKQRFIKRIKHGLSSGYHRIKKKIEIITATRVPDHYQPHRPHLLFRVYFPSYIKLTHAS